MQAFQISLPTHFHWSHLRAYLTGSPEEMLHFEVGDWLYRWERGMGIFRLRVDETKLKNRWKLRCWKGKRRLKKPDKT